MRVLALVLLASCAPVVQPASLPQLRIDDTLQGHVVSRGAAEVIVTKRLQDKKACDARVTDCETKTKVLTFERDQQKKRADGNAWWSTYGPGLLGAGIPSAFLTGVAIALLVLRSVLGF